jgi:hypothetical protein
MIQTESYGSVSELFTPLKIYTFGHLNCRFTYHSPTKLPSVVSPENPSIPTLVPRYGIAHIPPLAELLIRKRQFISLKVTFA